MMMLKYARAPVEKALVLVLASSGVWCGALDMNWKDLVPLYRVGEDLLLDPEAESCLVACAALYVYCGSAYL